MFDQADLESRRDEVRAHLVSQAGYFARRGIEVVGVELDTGNGRPFPDLVVFLRSNDVDGERELPFYLGARGVLEAPSEVARSLLIWSTEVTPAGLSALPRSRRSP